MTYKELIEALQSLSPEQLNQEVIVAADGSLYEGGSRDGAWLEMGSNDPSKNNYEGIPPNTPYIVV